MDGYHHPFFSKVDSSPEEEAFPMPSFGAHESWVDPFYSHSDFVQSLAGVKKQTAEQTQGKQEKPPVRARANANEVKSKLNKSQRSSNANYPPIAAKRGPAPMPVSRTEERKSEPQRDALGFILPDAQPQSETEKNTEKLIDKTLISEPDDNIKPSTSASARARRAENLANKPAIKPIITCPDVLGPPSQAPPTPSTISEKLAQVAQTIRNRLNPAKPQKGTLVDDTLAVMTITTDDDVLIPREIEATSRTVWPKTAGPPPDYGPKWGQEIAVDFQSYRQKLPPGNLFQLRLFYDVLVTAAETPELFTVRNLETSYELNYMEENMKEWYDAYWIESANIDPKTIFKGCYYAGYVEDKEWWYRIRVEEYVADSKIRRADHKMEILVKLMDHGTTAVVAQDCIMPLRRVYGKLPIQAANASLRNVPNAHPWKKSEVEQFKLDVVGKKFQAFVTDCTRHKSEDYDNLTVVLLEMVGTPDERPYSLGDCCETDDEQTETTSSNQSDN